VNQTGLQSQKATVIIPARYGSVRLPGKPLLEIHGKPMILHVVERAKRAANISRVIVATDDTRILDVVKAAGYEAAMTRSDHASGTDRLAEVAESLDAEIIVNLQGDEPVISPEAIEAVTSALIDDSELQMCTTCERIESADQVLSPYVVKVVRDEREMALYFSRSPIPYPRDSVREHGTLESALQSDPSLLNSFRKHTGLYAYRRDFLLRYAKWPQSQLEVLESLEQLRALEHGIGIRVIELSTSSVGVDTEEDLQKVRQLIK
jgi:3-deoxy-manno-octulosonate cytidylyltransferase (CMP-KDO synthetase)